MVDLIEAYYAVAADLRHKARQQVLMAESLEIHADHLSEIRMKEAPMPDEGKTEGVSK